MTKFSFMSFLLIMLIVRNTILILEICNILIKLKKEFNITSNIIYFKVFSLIIIHPILYFVDDGDKISLLFQLFMLTVVISGMKSELKDNMNYLIEKQKLRGDING